MKRCGLAVLLCVTWVHSAFGANVWVLRGAARLPGCPARMILVWNADAVLYNSSDRDATIRLLDVSNGGEGAGRETSIPAGQARGIQRSFGDIANAPLWIAHFDVPAGLLIDGRLEYLYNDCTLRPQPTNALGKWATPVFREVVPAHRPAVHQGVDLGVQDTRLNVGIYNDGSATATATIQVFRTSCPDEPPVSQVVSVAPKTLIQTSIFQLPPLCAQPQLTVSPWVAHAVVTVDQPSLSYVVALSNVADPQVTVGFAAGH